jgi:hypothetical protein
MIRTDRHDRIIFHRRHLDLTALEKTVSLATDRFKHLQEQLSSKSFEVQIKSILLVNYWGVHPVARVSSNVNKPPYATTFGARFYCALTLHVSAPIGGHLKLLCAFLLGLIIAI